MDSSKLRNWLEIAGIVALIISLAILIFEVRENTQAINRQAGTDRAAAIAGPYFEADLAPILSKIMRVDGYSPVMNSYMETYDLTPEEAILWHRQLLNLWEVLESEFVAEGDSYQLRAQVRSLVRFRDNQIFIDTAEEDLFHPEFFEFIEEQRNSLESSTEQRE